MDDFSCPYCHTDLGNPDDCHEQDKVYEWHCYECGKKFIFSLTYSVTYHNKKAPCLNGEEDHIWQLQNKFAVEYYKHKKRFECKACTAFKIED